ncbi:MAG: type II toxin-antitoxin system VapC family toxin [Bacteroidota bacterium]
MHYLLDTHTLIWFLEKDKRLSETAQEAIEAEDTTVDVSIVSLWEISIKQTLKKLELTVTIDDIVQECKELGIPITPITIEAVKYIQEMPLHHRDPFDRLLVSHAATGELTLVTRDPELKQYDIETFW